MQQVQEQESYNRHRWLLKNYLMKAWLNHPNLCVKP